MTKDELFKKIEENTMGPRCWSDIRAAVDTYSSALLQQHDVSGRSEQLPLSYVKWLTNAEREAGTQAKILKNAGYEHSADCSGAMAFAYRYSRETYEKMLSGNCQ
jgi:hypothetical protein